MRRSIFYPRATEATAQQLVASGAMGGLGLTDPIDGDTGYRPLGSQGRQVPAWTLEKARAYSVAGYRVNPMAKAIIDTYVSFCVGDSGVSLQCSSDKVQPVAEGFWADPRNNLPDRQELMFRSHLLQGESVYEMLVGPTTGVARFSAIDPARVDDVELDRGNALWPGAIVMRRLGEDDRRLTIAAIDDVDMLRKGEVLFWASFRALETDKRGFPFLGPILDWLDSYDTVLSNLIDRTALARYLVFDVTVDGGQAEVDKFIKDRGGTHVPVSGSVEIHNKGVEWDVKTAEIGSFEDTNTNKAVLTNIAGGTGLAKTWLAEPEDANRATSLTMAEPVRRRVGGIQNLWLGYQNEMIRYAVDQAVIARRLPAEVEVAGPGNEKLMVPPSKTVSVTGPEVAAADAQVTAKVLVMLSQAITGLVKQQILSPEAAKVAAQKAWEDYMGVPYSSDLDNPEADEGDVATAVDDASTNGNKPGAVLATMPSA